MGRNDENINKAYKQGYKFTHKQLQSWGLKFHKFHMGKPSFDFLVDDKSIGFKKNWHSYLRKILKKNDYKFWNLTKFKKSFNKANLEMIKKLAKDMYPVSEKDVKKLIKASQ